MRPLATPRWLPALLLPLLCAAAGAEEDLRAARQRFLRDGDAVALAEALAGAPPPDEAGVVDVLLARLAASPQASPPAQPRTGYAALPQVVAALRRLDLDEAQNAVDRMEPGAPVRIRAWARALVLVRGGLDEEAIAVLLRLPARADQDEDRALFTLALLGAALEQDDRWMLFAAGRSALLEAARRGRLDVVERLARRLAVLDRARGGEGLCLAVRALRRAGRGDAARTLLAGVADAAGGQRAPCLLEEEVLMHWQAGRTAQARRLAAAAPPSAVTGALLAAEEPVGRWREVPLPARPSTHVPPAQEHAAVLARLASALGAPSTAAEVEAQARTDGWSPEAPGFARAFLESRGLEAAWFAGDPRVGEEALEAGLPFVLCLVRLEGERFVERPLLVRGREAATGLWIADPCDLRWGEVIRPEFGTKGRILLSAPARRGFPEGALRAEAREWGTVLAAALDRALGGDLDGAIADLEGRAPPAGSQAAHALGLAWLLHQRFGEMQDEASLHRCRQVLDRTVPLAPPLCFEHFARGQSLFASSEAEASREAFEAAQEAEPDSPYVARTRFAVLVRMGGRAREALEAIERAHRLDPLDTVSLYYRGGMRRRMGEVAGAREDLTRAWDRRPDAVPVAADLARLELDARRAPRALEILEALGRAAPEARRDPDVREIRRAAEETLVQAARSVPQLRPFLASPEPDTRRRVAFELASLESAEAEALLRTLLADPDAAVRVTTLRLYGRPWLRARVEGEEGLGRQVVELLRGDAAAVVRGAAAGLLGLVDAEYAAVELAASLAGERRDPDPYPRSAAASALVRHDGPLARATLVAALEDEDLPVRRAAIEALFRIASTYLGYDPEAGAESRAGAVSRWRAWLEENGR